MTTVSRLVEELQKHPDTASVVIADGQYGPRDIDGAATEYIDGMVWLRRTPFQQDNSPIDLAESDRITVSDPTPEQLSNLEVEMGPDIAHTSEEIRMERKRRFVEIVSDKMSEIIGDHSMTKEDKEALREGYMEILGGGLRFHPSPAVVMPAIPQLPISTYTEVIRRNHGDCLVTIDFIHLLSISVSHSLDLLTMTVTLSDGAGHSISLTKSQTKALIRFISGINSNPHSSPFNTHRLNETFLSHPAIQSILNEVDAEFPEDSANA